MDVAQVVMATTQLSYGSEHKCRLCTDLQGIHQIKKHECRATDNNILGQGSRNTTYVY
jgi:hypothetical protein